jgi:hypothetical protein
MSSDFDLSDEENSISSLEDLDSPGAGFTSIIFRGDVSKKQDHTRNVNN